MEFLSCRKFMRGALNTDICAIHLVTKPKQIDYNILSLIFNIWSKLTHKNKSYFDIWNKVNCQNITQHPSSLVRAPLGLSRLHTNIARKWCSVFWYIHMKYVKLSFVLYLKEELCFCAPFKSSSSCKKYILLKLVHKTIPQAFDICYCTSNFSTHQAIKKF